MVENDELYQHGVKGQRWGIRRYQRKDGTLTNAGRKRYLDKDGTLNDAGYERVNIGAAMTIKTHGSAFASEVKGFKEANDEWKKSLEPVAKFHKNKKLYSKYLEKAARESAKELDITDEGEIKALINGYKYGDLNQGFTTAFRAYCRDKGLNYKQLAHNYYEADKKRDRAIHKFTDKVMETTDDTMLKELANNDAFHTKARVNAIIDNLIPNDDAYYWEGDGE